jgi:hypothetical protein
VALAESRANMTNKPIKSSMITMGKSKYFLRCFKKAHSSRKKAILNLRGIGVDYLTTKNAKTGAAWTKIFRKFALKKFTRTILATCLWYVWAA